MRWAQGRLRWVRPIQSVLCVFDGDVLNVVLEPTTIDEVASFDALPSLDDVGKGRPHGIKVGNMTLGHRFLAPEAFKVKDFTDYKAKLKKAHVVLDPAERREAIWKEATKLAKAEGLTVKEDDALLAEVAGMVEWPKVLIGGIDQAFMDLPAEVLTTVMRHNQKYFSLLKSDGSLAPRFIVVADTEPDDGGRAITAGNERVLKARLADARFFWDQDRKQKLKDRVPALEGMIFHAKLGTLAEKVARVQALAAELVPCIPGADVDRVRRGALLSKADLTTEMVKEFPELQGVMGRYYALHDGEKPEVADAIAEHYAPLGPSDRCPTAPVSAAVALADKIDSLVGFFDIGERPTGSKDPYALRRAALGIIRLILENELRLPLRKIFGQADMLHAETPEGIDWDRDEVINDLLAFFADRLKVHLREKGVGHDLIDAVFALGGEDDLVRLMARVESLQAFLDTEDGEHLLTAYKRAANIVRIEEKRDGVSYDGAADTKRFKQPEERDLHDWLGRVKAQSDEVLKEERFDDAMKILAGLRKPVDVFFDEVTVNCDEAELRENRLKLLSEIRTTMNTVADFSRIEG
jgi:glycyl-tRNA synthetase beta chain